MNKQINSMSNSLINEENILYIKNKQIKSLSNSILI